MQHSLLEYDLITLDTYRTSTSGEFLLVAFATSAIMNGDLSRNYGKRIAVQTKLVTSFICRFCLLVLACFLHFLPLTTFRDVSVDLLSQAIREW